MLPKLVAWIHTVIIISKMDKGLMVIFAIVLERDVMKNTVIQMIVAVFMLIRTLVDKSRYILKLSFQTYINLPIKKLQY
jgi:hypothetical protein